MMKLRSILYFVLLLVAGLFWYKNCYHGPYEHRYAFGKGAAVTVVGYYEGEVYRVRGVSRRVAGHTFGPSYPEKGLSANEWVSQFSYGQPSAERSDPVIFSVWWLFVAAVLLIELCLVVALFVRRWFSKEERGESDSAAGSWLYKLKGMSGRRLYWATIVVLVSCASLYVAVPLMNEKRQDYNARNAREKYVEATLLRLKAFTVDGYKGSVFDLEEETQMALAGDGDSLLQTKGGWLFVVSHSYHSDKDPEQGIGDIQLAVDSSGKLYKGTDHWCGACMIENEPVNPLNVEELVAILKLKEFTK